MNAAITIGRRHGSLSWELVAGPEFGPGDQMAAAKGMSRTGTHADYCEVQVWQAHGGLQRRYNLKPISGGETAPETKPKRKFKP